MNEDQRIYRLTIDCDNAFANLAKNSIAECAPVVAELYQRFDEWAKHLGARAHSSLSLDTRLMCSETLRELVSNYLQVAQGCLENVVKELGKGIDPASLDTDTHMMGPVEREKVAPLLADSLVALESAVDGLYYLGIAIRQSSTGALSQRVQAFIDKNDDSLFETVILGRLKQHLIEGVQAVEGSQRQAKDTGKVEVRGAAHSICRQLAVSVTFRHFMIIYQKRHEEKLATRRAQKVETLDADKHDKPVSGPGQEPWPHETHRLSASNLRHARPITAEHSESAPTMPDFHAAEEKSTPSLRSFVSGISMMADNVDFPKPPVVLDDQQHAPCPYCRKLFTKDNYQSDEWWRCHVRDDLQLYACISESCFQPPRLFSRLEKWKQHMDGEHTKDWIQQVHPLLRWCCDLCPEEKWFDKETDIESHILVQHKDYSDNSRLATIKEWCEVRLARPAWTCPICNCIPSVLQPIANSHRLLEEDDVSRETLLRHVATHLEKVGFLSITLLPGDDKDDKSLSSRVSQDEKDNVSLPGWEPWPPATEDSAGRRITDPEDSLIPDTADDFFEFMNIPVMQELRVRRMTIREDSRLTLSTVINENITLSAFPRDSKALFSPRTVLNSITYASTIQYFEDPENGSQQLDETLVEYILNCLRELFAIFIAIAMPAREIVRFLQAFQKEGVTDNDIPQIQLVLERLPHLSAAWKAHVNSHRFIFQAPEFSQQSRSSLIYLHPEIPLPIESCHGSSWSGGFSTVHQIRIHPLFDEESADKRTHSAAIKEFSEGRDAKAWQREVIALQKIGGRNLYHVVDLKAMFVQSSKIYLVFPWANGGNLMEFWRNNDDYDRRFQIARELVPHILRQLEGLSSALESLHNFNGNGIASYRHGDLKPENILLFRPENGPGANHGIWKISDLGLAKLHEKATGHRYDMPATSMRPFGTTSYKPPEAWTQFDEPTSRLFDIWSMGCIVLELITWLVYGMKGLEELTRETGWLDGKRSCYWLGDYTRSQGWSGLTVHPYVTNLINRLRTDLEESPALRQLLEVVETKLLVIDISHPRKEGVYRYRTDAPGLYESIRTIRQNCERDSSNWSSSWKAIRESSPRTVSQGPMGNAKQRRND